MRVNQLDLHQHLIACDDKFALWITPTNRVRFSDTLGRGMDTAAPIEGGRWVSLVAVFFGYSSQPTGAGVGTATTNTVVLSSVFVLIFDFIMTSFFT